MEIPVVRIKPMMEKNTRMMMHPAILAYVSRKVVTAVPKNPPAGTMVVENA